MATAPLAAVAAAAGLVVYILLHLHSVAAAVEMMTVVFVAATLADSNTAVDTARFSAVAVAADIAAAAVAGVADFASSRCGC